MVQYTRLVAFVLLPVFLTVSAFPAVQGVPSEAASAVSMSSSTGSIYIFGNDDFTAENGVVSGSGSSGDPYIIEGRVMRYNNTGTGITVVETDRYFVIRDMHITGAKIGMRFDGVYHARVTSCTIENCSTAFSASYSEVSRIDNCLISNNSVGVSLRYCDAFKVEDITFVNTFEEIRIVALPWIKTRQADLLFEVIAVILCGFVVVLLYMRYKATRPPDERP